MMFLLLLLGIALGLAVGLGIPWWVGHEGHSVYWLLLVALGLNLQWMLSNLSRASTARVELKSFIPILTIGTLITSAILLVPFFVGRWMAQG